MKKTKRFVLSTAIVASLALGATTAATSAQTSQAAGLSDIGSEISSILSGGTGTATTSGVDVSSLGDSITLPGGTTPSEESIEAALGGSPTYFGLIPASIDISDDGTTVSFTPDLSSLGSLGNTLSSLVNKIATKKVTIKYTSSLTFAGGQTSANIKKGTKIDLENSGLYKITPSDGATIDVVDNGGFNYAYPGTYNVTVKATYPDSSEDSEDTALTINVLDAQWSNTDQTILKGQQVDPSLVTATDTIGNTLDVTADTSNVNTSKVGDYQVTYTGTDQALGYDGNPMTWTKTGTVHVVDSDSSQVINFQDANSGQIVDTTTITGADGQSKSVTAPDGYDLVNSSDDSITLQKGTHTSTVQVVRTGSSVATDFSGTVSTYANGGVVPLYDSEGTQTSRSLAPNSDWASDQTKTINGDKFYRVSTNEWVKASQVYEYTPENTTVTTNSDSIKSLYSIEGNKSSRSLAPNTAWYTDRVANINGTQMYRVSTDEWVSTSDVH